MTVTSLLKRLDRIEAKHHVGAPTKIFADRPITDDEAQDALTNWREWVADGRAKLRGDVLLVVSPPMTVEEWEAAYCTRARH
ncbi:hypothetical protein [Methylobacterium oryzisoli]|uniref:hypothetical protein n=1 Tax=Methylobacterium oryzisoli TaxID=3385502 RepID=UPI0038911C65